MSSLNPKVAFFTLLLLVGASCSSTCVTQDQVAISGPGLSPPTALEALSFRNALPGTAIGLDYLDQSEDSQCRLLFKTASAQFTFDLKGKMETTFLALQPGRYDLESICTTSSGVHRAATSRSFELVTGQLLFLGTLELPREGEPSWRPTDHPRSKDLTIHLKAQDRKRLVIAETGKALFF